MLNQKQLSTQLHYAVQDPPTAADTSNIKRKFLDIPYAWQSMAETLDIYLPEHGVGPYPVILAIHGGAFMGGDKADWQLLPILRGLERGYAVVSVNYRLSGEAKFPAPVHDVKAAVRWLRANALRYHFDPDRVAAWGWSAGGYLASMLGTSAGVPELESLRMGNPGQPSHVQAVVSWHAPINFLEMDEQLTASGLASRDGRCHNDANSPESLLLGRKITATPARVKAVSPETYIQAATPPFLIQHGAIDAVVPVQQSIAFAGKLASAIGDQKVHLEILEDAGHADARFRSPENIEKILDFIDLCLYLK